MVGGKVAKKADIAHHIGIIECTRKKSGESYDEWAKAILFLIEGKEEVWLH